MRYERWKGSKYWAIYSDTDELVSITLYKKGAVALIRQIMRLEGRTEEEIRETLLKSEQANKPAIKSTHRKIDYQTNA